MNTANSSTFLGCIADDFTGATDLAGMLARSGAKVSLYMDIPETTAEADSARPGSEASGIEIIALKCRTAPADDAKRECLKALDWLRQRGAQRFFWKYCSTFDSTDKGNIGPVAEALMAALDCRQTIYCPAFPENGRSIFMGNLFVGQQPLAESPMKNHPLTPMKDSNLQRLLNPQVTRKTGLIDRLTVAQGSDAIATALRSLANDDVAHIVTDAVANEDLYSIAAACKDMALLTGGSAIAMPLPALYAEAGLLDIAASEPHSEQIEEPAIVLSGSCSAMTQKQVANYSQKHPAYQLDPIELAKAGPERAINWLQQQSLQDSPILYATADATAVAKVQDTLGVEAAGKLVEDTLAAIAVAACESGRRRFVVAGGETSGAVTQALDISKLDIGREIAPGVPWTYCSSGDGSNSGNTRLALALKSGNFGAEAFFHDALVAIDA